MNNTMPNFNPFQQFEMPNYLNQGFQDFKNFENRIYNLEKEIINVKNRISKLENLNNNYTTNYKPNSYNMM